MAIVQVVQDECVIALESNFQGVVQAQHAVQDDTLVRLNAARAQRWTEKLAHGSVVCWILSCEDVSAGDASVEGRFEEDAAFVDGGVDVAKGFDGVRRSLTRSEAGNFPYKISIDSGIKILVDGTYRISSASR